MLRIVRDNPQSLQGWKRVAYDGDVREAAGTKGEDEGRQTGESSPQS